ncbi:MAG: S-ribosylhomocysteine lyase [Clostridia bacterium]
MKTIHSFTIDHDMHDKGFYFSSEANNIFTYDLRFKTPNGGDYLSNPAMHTIEHLFATVVRNSSVENQVVYFGPMGCRTGFYLLLLGIQKQDAFELTKQVVADCLKQTVIPGCERKNCGNYLEHNLADAKKELSAYLEVLNNLKF